MVITRRSASGIVVIWIAAVVSVSATAWVAIDRAGRDITNVKVTTMPSAPVTALTTSPEPTMTTSKPTATPKLTTSPKPSAVRTPAHPAVIPTPRVTPSRRGTPRPAPPGTPGPQDRTQVVDGGYVKVRCTGATIALLIAQPLFDWRVRADTSNGGIYVSFRTGEEESQRRTQVTAVCRDGNPTFTVARS